MRTMGIMLDSWVLGCTSHWITGCALEHGNPTCDEIFVDFDAEWTAAAIVAQRPSRCLRWQGLQDWSHREGPFNWRCSGGLSFWKARCNCSHRRESEAWFVRFCSPKVGSKEKAKATTHTLQKALHGRLLVSVMPMNSGALHEDFGACTPIFQQLTEEREVFTCPSQEHAVPKCSRRLLLFRVKTLHLWNCNSLISLCWSQKETVEELSRWKVSVWKNSWDRVAF